MNPPGHRVTSNRGAANMRPRRGSPLADAAKTLADRPFSLHREVFPIASVYCDLHIPVATLIEDSPLRIIPDDHRHRTPARLDATLSTLRERFSVLRMGHPA